MPENEKPEPNYLDMETANVEVPKYGDVLPAKVKRLGMTTAKEIFGVKARNPDQKILMIFAESDDGTKAKTPVSYYSHPSPKSNIAKFVRSYGQPTVGMSVQIIRDDNGFWGLKL